MKKDDFLTHEQTLAFLNFLKDEKITLGELSKIEHKARSAICARLKKKTISRKFARKVLKRKKPILQKKWEKYKDLEF